MIAIGKEDLRVVAKDVGEILIYASALFVVPLLASIYFNEGISSILWYVGSAVLAVLLGGAFKFLGDTNAYTLTRHALFATAVFWPLFTLIASIPLIGVGGLDPFDAYFESMSMITTTGMSMYTVELDSLPSSVLLWRSFISWVGGIGIIILALTGVLAAYVRTVRFTQAEGREDRIRPHVINTVHEIWSLYVVATLVGVLLLMLLGMDAFSAVNYAMSAIATNGAVPNSNGLLDYPNYGIELVLMLLMVFGGIGFTAHYLVWKKGKFNEYVTNPELKAYFFLILLGVFLQVPALGLKNGLFYGVNAATSGGFNLTATVAEAGFTEFSLLAMAFLMIVGGSIGSTAGGIKVGRLAIIVKSLWWKVKESILPKDVYFRREFNKQVVTPETLNAVYSFAIIWILVLVGASWVLTWDGASAVDALFEVSSSQSNVGITTGIVHQDMPWASQLALIIVMWVGRLEIIPVMAGIAFLWYYRKNLK